MLTILSPFINDFNVARDLLMGASMGTFNPPDGSSTEVIDGPGVHIEADARSQLERVAGLPDCVRTIGMPDLHPGPGLPIGMATASLATVYPTLVGSDAGCGVTAAIAGRVVAPGKLLRRIDEATTSDRFEVDPLRALEAVWRDGPRGLSGLPGVPEAFSAWVSAVPWTLAHGPSGPLPDSLRETRYAEALGTVGGGNHFLELARVERVVEANAFPGLQRGAFVVLAHSGSRGLGRALIERWHQHPLREPEAVERYLGELAGCCRFAQANRAVLVWRLLRAVGSSRVDRIPATLDLVHNDVTRDEGAWVHRKGAAPAHAGQLTITLGSRGAASWILRGRGDRARLCSVAHGAGRKIPRAEAKARLAHRYRRTELRRTAGGGEVLCDRTELLWEEHPDVYKPIEPVVAALERAGIATRVASMVPLVTVKR